MTPQPIDGTLLAAFTRFADLSQYWHRAHTPDSLAIQELQERQRLLVDIPELIKRLTAFSELGTDAMFAAYAKAKAAPPRDDAGQGWRMLEIGEVRKFGDQFQNMNGRWVDLPECSVLDRITDGHYPHRRRIAKEPPQDTAGHIRADFEPSLAESLRKCTGAVEVTVKDGTRQETAKACDCGASEEDWRMLEAGELIEPGDEWRESKQATRWFKCVGGSKVAWNDVGYFRRRVTPPTPKPEPPQP